MRRAFLLCLLAGTWLCGCSDENGLTPNGGTCDFDDECMSGFCDREICRASDGSGGSIANGHSCSSNAECVSNNCYEGLICRAPGYNGSSKLSVGDSCTSDSQCSSKNCNEGYCAKAETKMGIGGVCSGNSQCTSNNCVSGVCNRAGFMEPRYANGTRCTSDSQCATNNCYEGKVCRFSSSSETTSKLGNGHSCSTNDQCVSGNCYEGKVCRSPDWSGSAKLDLGDSCSSSSQCASAYCASGVCQVKGSSSVSTSGANSKYCDAMLNDCKYTDVYRNYNGCLETMNVLRSQVPGCTKEWDNVYTCMAAQSCNDIEIYDRAVSELTKSNYVSSWVPKNCVSLAQAYVDCRY